MEIIDLEIGKIKEIAPNLQLCLGFFDSLHLGHISLINKALETHKPVAVMTFDVPPISVIYERTKNCSITSIYDKSEILSEIGVDYLLVFHFDTETMKLSKDDFIELVLKKINPEALFVGEDYRFGKGALGSPNYLEKFFPTHVVDILKMNGEKVATSTIIEEITSGKISDVINELGRYYQITGLVVEGYHNGSKIGFPTANLELGYPYVLPKIGVYLGRVDIYGQQYFGIVSVSTHPTIMELNEPIIEINIEDYDGNLYGKEISVEFLEYIGDIEKFDSLEKLKERLKKYQKYLKDNKSKYSCI